MFGIILVLLLFTQLVTVYVNTTLSETSHAAVTATVGSQQIGLL